MSRLLNQLHDEKLDFTVEIPFEGRKTKFDFLDIVLFEGREYAVVAPKGEDYVEIFLIENCDTDLEFYTHIDDEELQESIFEIFQLKNEDEWDF